MATTRQQARRAALEATLVFPEDTADLVSDIWEEKLKLIRTIIDDCSIFSPEECIKSINEILQETLGEK